MSPGPSVYIITYENHHQIIASGASHAGLEGRSRGALLMQDVMNPSEVFVTQKEKHQERWVLHPALPLLH